MKPKENAGIIRFPWPPHISDYWRNPPKCSRVSPGGSTYRRDTGDCFFDQHSPFLNRLFSARLGLLVVASPPCDREIDYCSIYTAVVDAMSRGLIIQSANRIDDFAIVRGAAADPGQLTITITRHENEQPK